MKLYREIRGDLFAGVKADKDEREILIPHVCNDKGGWGSGFLKTAPESKRLGVVIEGLR